MNIVNVGYDSTNYYALTDKSPKLQHECKRMGIADLKYFLITHYHPDHAGLAQELKRTGVKLIVIDLQLPAIPVLKTYMKPQNHYVEIDPNDNLVITLDDSRAFLARLGIDGEIIATPGHSDDSVSLVLDEHVAFTGDLARHAFAVDDPTNVSWDKIRALGVKTIYPGHGPSWQLD